MSYRAGHVHDAIHRIRGNYRGQRARCHLRRATVSGGPGSAWQLNEMPFRRYAMALVGTTLAVACAVVFIAPLRTSVLRSMGRFLVATEPLQPADVIVVSVDSDGAGVLEATDLLREHLAARVALFADPP